MCSWAIVIHKLERLTVACEMPHWTKILLNKGGVHLEFICELKKSPIANMPEKVLHLGVVLDMCVQDNHAKYLAKLKHAHVPVWFIFRDPQNGTLVYHCNNIFVPSKAQVDLAGKAYATRQKTTGSGTSPSQEASLPPAPPLGSGQRARETMEAIFAHRKDRHDRLA